MKWRIALIFSAVMVCAAACGAIVRAIDLESASATCDTQKTAWCLGPRLGHAVDTLGSATVPKLATPAWLNPPAPAGPTVVTYNISTRGAVTANLDEFAQVVAATLNDPRGWTRLGVRFDRVDSGGQFTMFLSESSQMTTFSATGCDATYSCNVGRSVIINQDRWLQGAQPWTAAGGDLATYRQMVINHETGHWLGHGHRSCSASGQPAPVMQQQSMSMQGCTPNAWPLSEEMYSPTLGIRS